MEINLGKFLEKTRKFLNFKNKKKSQCLLKMTSLQTLETHNVLSYLYLVRSIYVLVEKYNQPIFFSQ